jgi:hypothetical protein
MTPIGGGLLPWGVHEGLESLAPQLKDLNLLAGCCFDRVPGTWTWIIAEPPHAETGDVNLHIVTVKTVIPFVVANDGITVMMANQMPSKCQTIKLTKEPNP